MYISHELSVMCRKVLSIDDYSSHFKEIDPLAPFKKWKVGQPDCKDFMYDKMHPPYDVYQERFKVVFVVSAPVDWGRDLQVVYCMFHYCKILSNFFQSSL